jgi:D-alanyl-D-alanine carboxypeptidase (penicillin-binding protein 5/6)
MVIMVGMVLSFFTPLISLFLSIHGLLYTPQFSTFHLPLGEIDPNSAIVLTTKTSQYQDPPIVGATAAIVVESHSAEVVFAKNPRERLFPASTTKIMTALLAIEELDLDHVASVSSHLASDGSRMGLLVGEKIKVRDLLAGLLIPSANDAADEFSKIYPGGTEAFVARMNARAKELGLVDTHYTNPIGYSDPGHVTSVHDLAILAREAMQHKEFADLVSVQNRTVTSIDGSIVHKLHSTNELLGKFGGMEGIKTGWTQEAGECFVAQASRDGETFVTVVLKSPDRFAETKKLLDWSFTSFQTTSSAVKNL